MSDLDVRLTAALLADAPAARDVVFRLEVIARLEQRQFRRRVIQTMTVAVVAVLLVALNAQAINAWMAMDARRLWIVALVAVAVMFPLPGLTIETLPGARLLARVLRGWLYP
jgi:hypothetical protein